MMLKDGGHLFYGGDEGFWDVTVVSLIGRIYQPWEELIFYIMPIGVAITLVIVTILWIRARSIVWNEEVAVPVTIMAGCVIGQILMNILLDVNYPEDRVGLYYLPLMVLVVVHIKEVSTDPAMNRLMRVPMFLIWLIPANTVFTLNVTHTRVWEWEAATEQFFQRIVSAKDSLELQPVIAGGTLQTHSYNYYNMRTGWPLHSMQDHISGSDIPDFQYSFPEGSGSWWTFDTTLTNPATERVLLRRSPLRSRELLYSADTSYHRFDREFIELFSQQLDTAANFDLLFDLNLQIRPESTPMNFRVVLDVSNEHGENVLYIPWHLDVYKIGNKEILQIANGFVYPGSFKDGTS